jgi:uncharacterized damage-inducible protein DinB
MNVPETYDYLVRARRDLWSTLEGVPDEVLSRPLLNGSRLHCIKDLVAHVPTVEDFWLHEDILHQQPVRETIPALKSADWAPSMEVSLSKRCWTTGALSSTAPSPTSAR